MTETATPRPDLFLPEPTPREVRYTVISVDDHLVEPPDMFVGRLPARLSDRAPQVIEADGQQVWEFEGQRYTQVGMNAVAGRRPETYSLEPTRFEEMRRGCWDIHARVRDMDLAGIWASMNFPSQITGFCGRVFSTAKDPDLGLAVTRAWNDWLFEEWYSPYPDRIIAACEETGTVISLHVGSSGVNEHAPGGPNLQLGATLFGALSLEACAEWLWSAYAVRHPELKIVMSEGGIGWVAMLLDRLDNLVERSGYGRDWPGDQWPAEVLGRNFYFCTFDDPSTIVTRHRIGVDHIMLEVDYPHGDSTWPDTQDVVERYWGELPVEELRMMTHQNAARVYRHPLPERCLP